MRLRIVMILTICTVMVLGPVEAVWAGGNWIDFNRRYLVAGKKIVGKNRYFDRQDATRGPYYAYLLPETRDWTTPLRMYRDAHVLGRVDIEWLDTNTQWKGSMRNNPKLTFTGTVPEVQPGGYLVGICNMPCTDRLSGIGPTGVSVVSTAVEARLRGKIDRLQFDLDMLQQRARRARLRESRELAREIETVESEAAARIATLEGRISSLRRSVAEQAKTPWRDFLLTGLAVTALVLAVAGLSRGHHRRKTSLSVDWDQLLVDQVEPRERVSADER